MNKHKYSRPALLGLFLTLILFFSGCSAAGTPSSAASRTAAQQTNAAGTGAAAFYTDTDTGRLSSENLPAYSGYSFVIVNDNVPAFTAEERTAESFESYSDLDSLGRCGAAFANVGTDLMPTERRGYIGDVRPSGWHTVKYNDIIDGNYLYNRCHLIGYQLTGENANTQNLITGTRWLNVQGMLPFENAIAEYVKSTGNHVLYRVTPIFEGENLVASGVEMEGESMEDNGASIHFHIYAFNIQPGISIDYVDGESWEENDFAAQLAAAQETQSLLEDNIIAISSGAVTNLEALSSGSDSANDGTVSGTYVLNTNTKKFHLPECESVRQMGENNKEEYEGSRDTLLQEGYEPCKSCNP